MGAAADLRFAPLFARIVKMSAKTRKKNAKHGCPNHWLSSLGGGVELHELRIMYRVGRRADWTLLPSGTVRLSVVEGSYRAMDLTDVERFASIAFDKCHAHFDANGHPRVDYCIEGYSIDDAGSREHVVTTKAKELPERTMEDDLTGGGNGGQLFHDFGAELNELGPRFLRDSLAGAETANSVLGYSERFFLRGMRMKADAEEGEHLEEIERIKSARWDMGTARAVRVFKDFNEHWAPLTMVWLVSKKPDLVDFAKTVMGGGGGGGFGGFGPSASAPAGAEPIDLESAARIVDAGWTDDFEGAIQQHTSLTPQHTLMIRTAIAAAAAGDCSQLITIQSQLDLDPKSVSLLRQGLAQRMGPEFADAFFVCLGDS